MKFEEQIITGATSHILIELNDDENVYVSLLMLGFDKKEAMKKANMVLEKVDLSNRKNYYPSELSDGQQQRVSIARALVNNPKILFANEFCANLDLASSKNVLDIFKELNS
jgi:putative ABC transport system ATP-binding protein